MKFTLRQLQIFLAVAKYQNISKAAQSLHMAQSAASEALLNLEHTYSVTLFDRVSNKLALNAIGHTLRKEAETLLAHCHSFEEKLMDHTDCQSSQFPPHPADTLLRDRIAVVRDLDHQWSLGSVQMESSA